MWSVYNSPYTAKAYYNAQIRKKKEEARHYRVTERTIQRDLETIRSVLEEERKMGRDDRMLLYDREQNGYKICRVYEKQKEDTEERSM